MALRTQVPHVQMRLQGLAPRVARSVNPHRMHACAHHARQRVIAQVQKFVWGHSGSAGGGMEDARLT